MIKLKSELFACLIYIELCFDQIGYQLVSVFHQQPLFNRILVNLDGLSDHQVISITKNENGSLV